ncbi:MAG: glycosyltransferase family 9 protein [Verrucomicrobia bacterium]|nr:glycosyltransferase family 9 protein [Verrucomicrobiota bacterium]
MEKPKNILVIRRDNIGDLICTTPLLRALREHFPNASISILVSSYNVEVLQGNQDIDETFVFLKRRHDNHGYHPISVIWKRWQLKRFLRKQNFDYIILANGGWRYARKLDGKVTIGFKEKHLPNSNQPDITIPREGSGPVEEHEVSKLSRLGTLLGISLEKSLGPTYLFPDKKLVEQERQRLIARGWDPNQKTIGVHISARHSVNRWPENHFFTLLKKIAAADRVQFILLWSPGLQNNPTHPGDDEKAERLLRMLSGLSIFGAPTTTISKLIATTSLIDDLICSDGGAMHVAAALQKPILSFFGMGSIESWHPWKTPHIALRAPSCEVKDISVEEAFSGFLRLQKK